MSGSVRSEVAQHRGVVEARRGGAADPGLGVVARQRRQHVGLVGPEFVHGRDAHTRVGVLPARLWPELLQEFPWIVVYREYVRVARGP